MLCDAFAEYPVMRYILGEQDGYPARLRILIGFFHGARVLREDAILGISDGRGLSGVALCSLPDRVDPPELELLRERTWTALGAEARARHEDCVRAWESTGVDEPNIHVNMLAVSPDRQGRGLARALLERVNVALYRHLGYQVVGRATIAPGFETWDFFRPD